MTSYELNPIGLVRSPLKTVEDAPKQGSEGGPSAWIEILPEFEAALHGVTPGSDIVVFTWLHRARRDSLEVHPRDDPKKPITGVFATRSADRPNPIGLHPVKVIEIDGLRLKVWPMEAIDRTPVIDIKPALKEGRPETPVTSPRAVARRRSKGS